MKINFPKFLLAILSVILLSNNNILAQRGVEKDWATPLQPSAKATPIYFGPALGVNIMGHSMNVPTFVEDNLCPVFEGATGLGFYGGLTLEYLFGDVATSSSSLIFRLLYNMFPGSNTIEGVVYPINTGATGVPVSSQCDDEFEVDYNAVTFEVMYKINPIPGLGLGIVAGPSFDFLIAKNWKHNFSVVDPLNGQFGETTKAKYPDVQFTENDRTITFYDNEIDDASAFRLGLKIGVQYEILLGSRLYIAPGIAYNFGITNVTSKYTWRVSPIQIGLDARFTL